jgi:hypothetical protein
MNRTAIIIAMIGYLTGCGESTSEPPPPFGVVTTVQVAAPNPSLFRNDTLRLTARVHDQHGADMPGIRVTWSSSNPLVATVDSTGQVVGLTAGQVSIAATAEGKSGSAPLTVIGPGTEGAIAGSALVGAAGGTVQATLPGGGGLALTIAAGSLDSTVQISLNPLVPGVGAQASFQLLPAGLQLKGPATLVVKVSSGARVRPTTVLAFEQDGLRVPVPSVANPADGTVTATVSLLGLPEASAPALRAASADLALALPGGVGSLLDLTLDDMFDDAYAALAQLQQLGTVEAAHTMELSMLAVVQAGGQTHARFNLLQFGWRTAVCDARDFAANALKSFGFVSDYTGLQRVVGAVLAWSRVAAQMADALSTASLPGCLAPLDAEDLVRTELRRMQSAIQADLNGFALQPSPRDSVFLKDRLSPLLDLVAALQLASFDAAAEELIVVTTAQFIRLRFIGYTECRGGQRQTIQGRLLRLEAAGGPFAAVSPFDVQALESDIQLCGVEVRWKLLDSTGAVTAQGALGGGTGPGIASLTGTGSITGPGRLELQGPLLALGCPAPASANAEQLEVSVGLPGQAFSQVSLLTPSNQNTYLAVSPLQLTFDAIRGAAGIAPDGNGQARVVIRRTGGTCSGQFVNLAHAPLGTLHLDVAAPAQPVALSIGTVTLPGGTVGSSYSASLQASGGPAAYQWSVVAGQLPTGLSLGAGGAITGTPTAAGTFAFTARVVSGPQNAERPLTITVNQPAAALEWRFDTDLDGWSCNSTNNCKWQLLTSQQFPQTSGWVALQSIGAAVSKTIAIPSNARFLRFDAATHNVPGDVSRVQVQVAGVTVLDSIFTNPGSNTAFNFVTMTIDISARAGQTINIRFVQQDDGQGGGTTLKVDNIRISAN